MENFNIDGEQSNQEYLSLLAERERRRVYAREYYLRKKNERLANGDTQRPVGRPRKNDVDLLVLEKDRERKRNAYKQKREERIAAGWIPRRGRPLKC